MLLVQILRKVFKLLKIKKIYLLFNSNKKIDSKNVKEISENEYNNAVQYLNSKHQDYNSTCLTKETRNVDQKYILDIIIPVYNVEKFVKICIDSILNQKSKYKYRIIIIDDGSTDSSGKIIDENYKNMENVLIVHQNNKGLAGARNTGLSYLSAKYVMFIDSDDFIPNDIIDVMLDNIISNNGDCIQGGYCIFRKEKIISNVRFENNFCASIDKLTGFAWGKIYKSNLWDNIIFPEHYWFEDTVIRFLISFRIKKFITIDKTIYFYRKNNSSISHISKGNLKSLDTVWCFLKCFDATRYFNYYWSNDDFIALMNFFALSFNRIINLNDIRLNKSMFILWRYFINNNFHNLNFINDKYSNKILTLIRYNKRIQFEFLSLMQ